MQQSVLIMQHFNFSVGSCNVVGALPLNLVVNCQQQNTCLKPVQYYCQKMKYSCSIRSQFSLGDHETIESDSRALTRGGYSQRRRSHSCDRVKKRSRGQGLFLVSVKRSRTIFKLVKFFWTPVAAVTTAPIGITIV